MESLLQPPRDAPRSSQRRESPAYAFLEVPIPPSANRYWRRFKNVVCVSAEAKAYKQAVAVLGREYKVSPVVGRVAVTLRVYRARKAGDLDNFQKCLLDSLQGVAYENDSQIAELHSYLGDDKRHPRVEVEVRAL